MKKKSMVVTSVMAAVLFGFSALAWIKESDAFSDSERRELAAFPKFSIETMMDGSFMEDFEAYTLDQFPFRDLFRRLKAKTVFEVLGQKDNNDIYIADGHASKMEYPLSKPMLDHAADRFEYLYKTYLQNAEDIYFAIVPDKNYFLAEQNGYLALDYEELFGYMQEQTSYMTYIDLTEQLTLEDFYFTDTHWKQENLEELADYLLNSMGAEVTEQEYQKIELEVPFYGVYYGQAALPMDPDTLNYLTNEMLEECKVFSYETGNPVEIPMYDMKKAEGKDPYEMFLSGTRPILTIENPHVDNGEELIVFRDSFGSSLVPLLAKAYEKITILDIRYVNSSMLGQFVEFGDQDVLFLYSTMLLNSSLALK